ncbi:hypothetical protein Tco_0640183 [Tanacetum coccineum]
MDLLTFIRTTNPTKVRIGERQRGDDEPKLLDTTIGRVVPFLPVTPARGESELEDSVDRLFDEEGNDDQAEQGDSASSGQGVSIQPVSGVVETNIGGVVLRRQEKRKSMIVDSDEPSHPAKKLRKDHGIPVGISVAGKSMPAIQRLLARAVQNAAVRGEPVPSLPFVTFVISSDSSHHSGTHIAKTEVDSLIRSSAPAMTTATTITVTAGAAMVVKKHNDFLVGDICTVIDPDSDLQKVYVLWWNLTNGSRLDDNRDCREMMTLSTEDEIGSLKERNAALEKEKGELGVRVVDLSTSVKVKEQEAAALDAMVTTVKLQNDRLIDQNFMSQLEKFQDERMKEVNNKFDKLDVDVIEMALHQEERFYPHLLTTIAWRRWLLTHGIKLAIAKCLHSLEYLFALGAAISRAIEKGMQDGLAAGITHGQEGRVLSDKSNKDASIETLMNILHLEEHVAERLCLQESQPHTDQLMVPIHHSLNQTVMGATSLSFSLDVSCNRVQKIKDNIAKHRSALHDVFVSIVKPLSSVALEGMESTSGTVPKTTSALFVTFVFVRSTPPISMDDYEIAHAEDQGNVGADVDPFPNVDDAKLIIS